MEGSKLNKSQSKYYNTACLMDEALILLLDKKEYTFITVKEICEVSKTRKNIECCAEPKHKYQELMPFHTEAAARKCFVCHSVFSP